MAEVVLDANVLVATFDAADSQRARAMALMQRLKDEGDTPVLLDVLVSEAVSVVCRRRRERRTGAPDLRTVLWPVRRAIELDEIRWVGELVQGFSHEVLDVVEQTGGVLNFNDALLVVLQRNGVIGDVATFDEGFASIPDFRRIR